MLAGRPDSWRLGRGLLAGRGMAAWMAAWIAAGTALTAALEIAPPTDRPHGPTVLGTTVLGTTVRPVGADTARPGADQLVNVLAQMALAHA